MGSRNSGFGKIGEGNRKYVPNGGKLLGGAPGLSWFGHAYARRKITKFMQKIRDRLNFCDPQKDGVNNGIIERLCGRRGSPVSASDA